MIIANTDDAADDGPSSTSYYNENTFDDIIVQIAGVGILELEPTKRGHKSNMKTKDVVDLEENKLRGVVINGRDNEDDDEDDYDGAASLNSSDISGDSTISEVSKKEEDARRTRNSYSSKPLVNDDESTIDMRPPAPETSSVSSYVEQLNQFNRSKGRLIKVGVFSACITILCCVVVSVIVTASTTRGDGGAGTNNNEQQVVVSNSTNNQVQSTFVGIVQPSSAPVMLSSATILPIQLTLQNIPDGPINVNVRESIIAFINVLLNQNLGESIEILDIADLTVDGSSTFSRRRRLVMVRRQLDLTLQLRIVVSGPSYYTEDEMRSLVIQTIDDRSQNIVDFLKSLDSETFQDVSIVVEEGTTFDVTGISSSTVSPSLSPQSKAPTSEPTMTLIASTTSSPTLSIEVITEAPITVSPSYLPSNSPSDAPINVPSSYAPSQSLSTNMPTPWRNLLKPQQAQPTPSTISASEQIPSPNYEDDIISPYGTATSPYGTATSPVGSSPVLAPDGSINQGPAGAGPNYVCANVTYTANWNMLLVFNCSLRCLTLTDCPGGHQCSPSVNCL